MTYVGESDYFAQQFVLDLALTLNLQPHGRVASALPLSSFNSKSTLKGEGRGGRKIHIFHIDTTKILIQDIETVKTKIMISFTNKKKTQLSDGVVFVSPLLIEMCVWGEIH